VSRLRKNGTVSPFLHMLYVGQRDNYTQGNKKNALLFKKSLKISFSSNIEI
jgi:hypothetical protein